MATLEIAIGLISVKHAGQKDKAGNPYVLHPLRVMLSMNTDEERIVAVLHDIIEDTDATAELLLDMGFSENIVNAVTALTKLKGESRLDAVQRTIQNPLATAVKIADVRHNMDLSRLKIITEKDKARNREYEKVLDVLLSAQHNKVVA